MRPAHGGTHRCCLRPHASQLQHVVPFLAPLGWFVSVAYHVNIGYVEQHNIAGRVSNAIWNRFLRKTCQTPQGFCVHFYSSVSYKRMPSFRTFHHLRSRENRSASSRWKWFQIVSTQTSYSLHPFTMVTRAVVTQIIQAEPWKLLITPTLDENTN